MPEPGEGCVRHARQRKGAGAPAAKFGPMAMRVLSAGLVALAALADSASLHGLAFDALAVAVPVAAVAALTAFGDVLGRADADPFARVQAFLTATTLALVVLAAAVRAPFVAAGDVPALGITAVGVCLAVFAVQALVQGLAAVPRVRLFLGLR